MTERPFFALYYFHYKISHKLVHHFLIHWYIFPPWYCNERGKKLEAEEVICSHVCNFMIHDLIVIADVAQFFLQYNNPRCCYNAANSLNLAVRQSRKTIIWKKEQVGEVRCPCRGGDPNWGVFWLQGVMHIILAKQKVAALLKVCITLCFAKCQSRIGSHSRPCSLAFIRPMPDLRI